MPSEDQPAPRQFPGVMISSTFTDLKNHRAAVIRAIENLGMKSIAMEHDSAKPDLDVIESSLRMVRDSSAYIGIISLKYGQTPKCPTRNPRNQSITELEFDEAQKLGRPILLFIMGEQHPVHKADIELDSTKRKKLDAFRERAKQMRPDSSVHRVYATFDSLENFKEKVVQSVADLRRFIEQKATLSEPPPQAPSPPPAIIWRMTSPDPGQRSPSFPDVPVDLEKGIAKQEPNSSKNKWKGAAWSAAAIVIIVAALLSFVVIPRMKTREWLVRGI